MHREARILPILLMACGGADGGFAARAPSATGGESSAGSAGNALLGAWRSGTTWRGDDLPCPLEIELFDDGTVEANFLSDDSEDARCSFARLPFTDDRSSSPHVLRMGGQLSTCLYQLDGDFLRLTCEDHSRPPRDFEESITLQRIRVRERRGLRALVGRWLGPAHWRHAAVLEVRPDGGATMEGNEIRIEVRGDRLDLIRGDSREKCLYRATERRLTLRCQRAESGYPGRISSPDAPMTTIVFVRAREGT